MTTPNLHRRGWISGQPWSFLYFLLLSLVCARADDGWDGHILTLTGENDAVTGSDRHYTHGARISYFSADDFVPRWVSRFAGWLPAPGFDNQAQKWGVSVGQEIYTPEDLDATAVVQDDRPYAGWLYISPALQRRGPGPGAWLVMETLSCDLGVVGPESQAEGAQKATHTRDPKGWDNQLQTEPGIALRYDRHYRLSWRTGRWGIDLLPQLEANLGNVDTSLGVACAVRAGYNIPNEFAVSKGRSHFGCYLHFALSGRYVLHNIFLDGNTYKSSHSVDKVPPVGQAAGGLTLVLKRLELKASFVGRSREFRKQDQADSYGSASITIKF